MRWGVALLATVGRWAPSLAFCTGRKTGGKIEGDIRLSGHPKEMRTFQRISGYVEQTDSNCLKYTVLESLMFSAQMRLGKAQTAKERKAYCKKIARMLMLGNLLKEPVYELPPDQKKCLSVGVELVGNPSILFLDEPTTGVRGLSFMTLLGSLG